MPRFFKRKGMFKRTAPKGAVRGRRRLQPAVTAGAVALGAGKVIKRAYNNYRARQTKAKNAVAKSARSNFRNRLEASDNIVTAKAVTIGKQKITSFQEKVSRSIRPALLFKEIMLLVPRAREVVKRCLVWK